jgi:hypothetical protein
MKFLLHYSVFLVFGLSLISCKKDKNEQVNPDPEVKLLEPSEELKSYAFFKPGSYWIYKNTTDNSIDSLYVLTVDTFLSPININYHIKFGLKDSVPKFPELFGHFVLMNQKVKEFVHVNGIEGFINDTTLLVNPGNYGISENRSLGLVNIQNQNYDSCRYIKAMNRVLASFSQDFFDYTCEVIWKKHIGILKFQQSGYAGLDSWELIRYDVIQ